MSNRYNHDGNNKGLRKEQKKYIPKNQIQSTNERPNPKPSLSTSLRQSLPKPSDSAAVSSSATPSMSRIQMGANGDWVSSRATGGSFVNYLPQDEAVATGLRAEEGALDPMESQRVVDLLNRELSRLLKLSAKEFWTEVARDTSLHEFLDSFLKFRSRWYDFPHRGANGIVAGVIVGECELSRRVFMVLYRMSSNRDPGARAADSLSLKDHGVLLQGKKLLDLPKLLDICAIYFHENEDLTRTLVENAIKSQPSIHETLPSVISHFLSIVSMMHQRCNSSLETLFSSGSNGESGYSKLQADFLEVIDFINDAIVTLDSFVAAYRLAAIFFSSAVEISCGNEDLLGTLARLHDLLLPSLQQGFQIVFVPRGDDMMSSVVTSLKMLALRVVSLGWKLLEICYLGDEVFGNDLAVPVSMKMFPANVEDPVIRADIFIQTLREINGISQQAPDKQLGQTFLQRMEKNHSIMNRINSLRNNGWIFVDDEQFDYISTIVYTPTPNIKDSSLSKAPVMSHISEVDEDSAMLESKICQIKDLFPEYGSGFLAACLVAYNQNPEEVIQRILEGTLHADLQSLDTSLETMPVPNSSAAAINRNDKGKGKLFESSTVAYTDQVSQSKDLMVEGPSVSSTFGGRYVRKSKDDMPYSETLDSRNEADSVRTAALVSQYEYEDEYDDSFDDLGISIAETATEDNEDLVGQKLSSDLGNSSNSKNASSAQNASNSKWGSKRKPQYYVKDGKNYSYKVAGSIAVSNSDEASLVTQAQKELIHGLGRGGNLPLGAVKKLTESEQDSQPDVSAADPRENVRKSWGRGSRRDLGSGSAAGVPEGQGKQPNVAEVSERGGRGGNRGRGRGGASGNHHRKDRAMKKHFAGLSGF
ncbi:activating signal cointegrator 1 complex subunit 2-like [Cucurbita pepo subsp. pepo]|uniref:activating signal cointegrator 1 complex subunit 2-like n=1 Tax=Cucurbita pepo subsp. pepo TaxID=3664 RepID=UPI000C9D61F7|nr:activating signal cointegrator 1 complex subunit 2-like [Cucurbita pepo subsp. pepo]